MPFAQVGAAPQGSPFAARAQVPASVHWPVLPHFSGSGTQASSAVPAGTFSQNPFWPHARQVPSQGSLQQTPSMQLSDWHWSAAAQGLPSEALEMHWPVGGSQ